MMKRRHWFAVALLLASCFVLMGQQRPIMPPTAKPLFGKLSFGWFQPFGDNEIELGSTIDDPVKLRMRAPSEFIGAISMNTADGTEVGMLGGRRDERYRGTREQVGQWDLFAKRPGANEDRNMRKIASFYWDHIQFHVPIISHAVVAPLLRSVDGRFRLIMQTDGNLVIYDDANVSVWSSGTAR